MTAAAYAVAPVLQEAEVPLVITVAASDDLTQRKASKYIARVSFTGGELGHGAGDYAYRKLGWRKVAAIAMADELGGRPRPIALDLARPEGIAQSLSEVGKVDSLVISAIERDQNTVRTRARRPSAR